MHVPALGPWLASLLLCVVGVGAVFRDEVDRIDFQHALLGRPIAPSTFFFQPTLSSKATLLYTISERGVVGAVNPKDGGIVWRQKQLTGLGCPQWTPGHLDGANGTNSVVSAQGDSVYAWEAASGRLLWSFSEIGCVTSLVVPDIPGLTQDPLVLMNDQGATRIVSLNAITGQVIWQVVDSVGDIPYAVVGGASNIFYVSLRPTTLRGYKIQVTAVHPKSAKPIKQNIVNADGEIKSEDDVLFIARRASDPVVVWADKSLKTVKINVLGTDEITTVKVPNPGKDAVEKISVHGANDPSAQNSILIHYQSATAHWAEIYNVDKKTKAVKKMHDLAKRDGAGIFAASSIKGNVFFSRLTQEDLTLHFATSGEALETWPISPEYKNLQNQAGGATYLAAEVVTRGTSNYAVRGAVILESDDLVLVRNGEVDWVREESLAGITAATWGEAETAEDLARELAIESHDNPVSAYIHRLTRHAKDLRHLPDWIRSVPARVLQSFTGAQLSTDDAGADFGFQKTIVATTENGRVVAIDTGAQGAIIWKTKVTPIPRGERWNVTDIRVTGDRVLVLAENGESALLQLGTGTVIEHTPPSGSSQGARVFPISTADGRSIMLPISAEGTPVANAADALKDDTVVVTRPHDQGLAGWMLSDGKTARSVWKFAPPEGESIVAIATRPAHDPVASIGRPLGDRNVLYKYLNPNVILVLTGNVAASTITVRLLDTVSGQTLYLTKHTGVDPVKPIAATMSENWFAYTFFADPALAPDETSALEAAKGYVLTMAELFASPLPNDPGPLEGASSFSSRGGPPYFPHVIAQSSMIPTPVTYLTTTSTKQGITPRALLAYCPAYAALVAIPVPMLAPRKPVGRDPTTAEREEGLGRYQPFLDFHPAWTISHARELLGISGMVVTPTHLESTSLVFAYGALDLFGTRVAPIGAFDRLGNGFGKVQLLLTVVALAVGTRFLAPLARRKQINTLWTT